MTAATRSVAVEGVGLWSPLLPGWDVGQRILRGEAPCPATPASRPQPMLLPANERRRAPDTVAIALEAAAQACRHAAREPAALPCVFTSTYGDLPITHYMCETLATDPSLLSPTRFHNSVHNAAAGYWTIAAGCSAPYTALSAGPSSFAAGLLEALTQAACGQAPVLLVAYDVEARGPLATVMHSDGMLAVALVLAPSAGAHASATLHWQLDPHADPRDAQPAARNAALVAGNAMAGCMPLLEALAGARTDRLCHAAGPQSQLLLTVERT